MADPRGAAFNRAPVPAKVSAPAGMQYVRDPQRPGKFKLAPKPGSKPAGSGGVNSNLGTNKPAAPKPSTTKPWETNPASPDGSLTAYLTDPRYQQERAELDYELNSAKNQYESLMGTDGARGSIWQDYDHAINALTRANRKGIGQANAALSGSNLAGSGIARKSLSDIAAEFFADQSKLNTDRTRQEADATKAWQESQTRFNSNDLANRRLAGERWRVTNEAPLDEPKKAVAPPGKKFVKKPDGSGWTAQVVKPKKAVAPPGMKFVKNKATGKYKAQRI